MPGTAGQRLQGKVALITGAATGIGKAIAIAMAKEGAAIAITYFKHPANDVIDAVKAVGGNCVAFQADVTKADDVQRLVDETAKTLGHLDILVNDAGVEKRFPFLETPLATWDWVIATNLTGPWMASQMAARQMVKQGQGGRIINISSVHEDLPMPTNAPYCVSKGGLRMLMRTICVELAPHKITVNNIAPGAIQTPINANLQTHPEQMQALLNEIPLGRVGDPDEVAGLAVYLASDEAAYVTGSTYVIDGGLMRSSGSL